MRWISFVAADLHKAFTPLFKIHDISKNPDVQAEVKKWSLKNIAKYLSVLEEHLKHRTYLACEKFTIADAYLFTVYQWTKALSIPTEQYPALNKYDAHVAKRPSVIAVEKHEEIYKKH